MPCPPCNGNGYGPAIRHVSAESRCGDCEADAGAPGCEHCAQMCPDCMGTGVADCHRCGAGLLATDEDTCVSCAAAASAERQMFSPVASAAESAGAVQAEAGDVVGLMEVQR